MICVAEAVVKTITRRYTSRYDMTSGGSIKRIYATAGLLIGLCIGVVGAPYNQVEAQQFNNVCEGYLGEVDLLLTESEALFSHEEILSSFTRSVSIPAGTYTIEALSFDPGHPSELPAEQQLEQWTVAFYSGGDEVFRSTPTPDIPDSDTSITARLAMQLSLPAIDTIVYTHSAYPEQLVNQQAPEENSVYPACLAFYEVEDGVEGLPPLCSLRLELSGVDQSTVQATVTLLDGTPALAVYDFDWGDGTRTQNSVSSGATHAYAASGTYTVTAQVHHQSLDVTCPAEIAIKEIVTEGQVLGATTGGSSTTVSSGGAVLGASATLAATGTSTSLMHSLVGSFVVSLAGFMLYWHARHSVKSVD